jgi:cell division protein FtsQ
MSSLAYRTDNYSGLKDNARYIRIDSRSKNKGPGRKSGGVVPPKPKQHSGLRRLFRWIVLGLSLVLIGELCFHFLIAPRLVVEEVLIVADRPLPLTDEDILRLAGVAQKDYYFSLDTEKMEQNLASYPLIKKAEAERIFPNKVKIVLVGREPLGMTLAKPGDKTVPLVFDEEGVVFQIGNSVAEYDLPVLSGISIPSVTLGMELPAELQPLLKDLYTLRSSAPQLFRIISELKVERKKDSRVEILFYPRQYDTKIRIGDRIDETMVKYILVVLDVLARERGAEIQELDFRTGEVVIRMNEG